MSLSQCLPASFYYLSFHFDSFCISFSFKASPTIKSFIRKPFIQHKPNDHPRKPSIKPTDHPYTPFSKQTPHRNFITKTRRRRTETSTASSASLCSAAPPPQSLDPHPPSSPAAASNPRSAPIEGLSSQTNPHCSTRSPASPPSPPASTTAAYYPARKSSRTPAAFPRSA